MRLFVNKFIYALSITVQFLKYERMHGFGTVGADLGCGAGKTHVQVDDQKQIFFLLFAPTSLYIALKWCVISCLFEHA